MSSSLKDFAKLFDGFSIGSNDLTQLTLGVDRDSPLVAHVYDENNLAVKTLIRDVIRVAHAHKRKIGICGQAPSDYPDFAEFLVREGIDSISLNPDTVIATRERIAYVEKTLGKTGKKTHSGALSLVATVGMMAALLIGVGAGCADTADARRAFEQPVAEVSPAVLRDRLLQKAQADMDRVRAEETARREAQMTTIHETTFGGFTVSYPSAWLLEHWENGLSLKSPGSPLQVVSIFKQRIASSVPDNRKQPITIGGREGLRYEQPTDEGFTLQIIEVEMGRWNTVELQGSGEEFERIISTLAFDPS